MQRRVRLLPTARTVAILLALSACTRKVQVSTPDSLVPQTSTAHALSLSEDGTRLLVGHDDGNVTVVDLEKRAVERVISARPPVQPIYGAVFLPLGRTGLVVKDGTVSVLEAGTDAVLTRVTTGDVKNPSAVLMQRPSLALVGTRASDVRIVDLDAKRVIASPSAQDRNSKADQSILAIALSADASTLMVSTNQPALRTFDAHSGTPLASFTDGMVEIDSVAFLPDGRTAVAGTSGGELWWIDLVARKISRQIRGRHHGMVAAIGISADGMLGASADAKGGLAFWDARSGAEMGSAGAPGTIAQMILSPAGDELYLSTDGGYVGRYRITRH